jgi:hypothetical protein
MVGMDRWNPWDALGDTTIELTVAPLEGERGRWTRTSSGDRIVLDATLDEQSRREVLAHELVHAERGVGWPAATASTMEVEEERVWRTALRRLVPEDEVRRFVTRRLTVGPVTIDDVAEEFDLSPTAARRVAQLIAVGAIGVPEGSAPEDL